MKTRFLALAAMFIFAAGPAPDLAAQPNFSLSAKKIPSKTGTGSYSGPSDSPGRPPCDRPEHNQGNHGRPPGGSGGEHRPGGNRPGGVNVPPVKPGHAHGGLYDRREDRLKGFRPNRDCRPNGCDGYYYGYYYDDPYKNKAQGALRDQNVTVTIVEPEPRTYFSAGPFEPFDDPRDK